MPVETSLESTLALEAYKILVQLLQSEDGLFWRRNEVMLAVNGGMITILGLLHSSQSFHSSMKAVTTSMCLIGFLISILWLFIVKRTELFYNHWYEQLKHYERQYLNPISIFQDADEFFATGQIVLGDETFHLNSILRHVRMYVAMQVISLVFAIIWLILGIFLLL